ncbi:MAG: site-specific integrase [Kiritimatiellae bacterium]|nr:site-specific integrase [Kiritimatiellia bacterium]
MKESVMSALRETVLLEMRLRGFAAKTVEAYIHALEQLWAFYRRALERLSCAEVQRFLDEVITVRKLAWATVNVYFSAYRFLYEQVLHRAPHEFSIPPRGRSGTRPGVLNRQEVQRLIDAPRNIKHRTLLAMTYGSGLRVSEAVRVRIADIDRGRMMLRGRAGQGAPGPLHDPLGAGACAPGGTVALGAAPGVLLLHPSRPPPADLRRHRPGRLLRRAAHQRRCAASAASTCCATASPRT